MGSTFQLAAGHQEGGEEEGEKGRRYTTHSLFIGVGRNPLLVNSSRYGSIT